MCLRGWVQARAHERSGDAQMVDEALGRVWAGTRSREPVEQRLPVIVPNADIGVGTHEEFGNRRVLRVVAA